MIRCRYFLSDDSHPVQPGDALWDEPLPGSRQQGVDLSSPCDGPLPSYGEYFTAAQKFIEDDYCRLDGAMLQEVRVYIEKHGQYSHPARVEVDTRGTSAAFVLNVAVTPAGRRVLAEDYRNLKKLNRRYPYSFLPRVYTLKTVCFGENRGDFSMMLGQWLEDFHEFHLSGGGRKTSLRTVIWDRAGTVLDEAQQFELYRKVARILTAYYNPQTFEQVLNWHHGAGDFIVRFQAEGMKVALITVRTYASMFETQVDPDSEMIAESLLLFLLNMTIRTRLDRMDGVGEMVFAPDLVVKATLKGFFDGLQLQERHGLIPEGLEKFFRSYLQSLAPEDIIELLEALARRYPLGSSGQKGMDRFIAGHSAAVAAAVTTL